MYPEGYRKSICPSYSKIAIILIVPFYEFTLHAIHPDSFIRDINLSSISKFMLFGLWAYSWISVACVCAIWVVVHNKAKKKISKPFYRMLSWFSYIMLLVIITLYITSSVGYWYVGSFMSAGLLEFIYHNWPLLIQYLIDAERTSFWIFVAIVIATFFLPIIVQKMWRFVQFRSEKSVYRLPPQILVGTILVPLIFINVVAWVGREKADFSESHLIHSDKRESNLKFNLLLRGGVNPIVSIVADSTRSEKLLSGRIPIHALRTRSGQEIKIASVKDNMKRNVILIVVESLRSDAILKNHEGVQVMPNLSSLARGGKFWENCYAQSTHSDYSDPCIISSLFPLRTVSHHYYSPSDPWPRFLIYDVLKQYGYTTAIISSQDETWGGMHHFLESDNLDIFCDSRSHSLYSSNAPALASPISINNSHTKFFAGKRDDSDTVQIAIEWIRHNSHINKPFFAYINLQASHFPYKVPDEYQAPFIPAHIKPDLSFVGYSSDHIESCRNAYFNALHYIDEQIGKLIKCLEDEEIRKNTIVILTGDHGEAFGENGVFTHAGPPVEAVVKVGVVFNCPGYVGQERRTDLVQAIDISPSILGLLGIPKPCAFQGRDIFKVDGDNYQMPVFIHTSSVLFTCDAVITPSRWKYVYNHIQRNGKLYHLLSDPLEQNELSSMYSERAKSMHNLLMEWRRRQLLYYSTPTLYRLYYAPSMPALEISKIVNVGFHE